MCQVHTGAYVSLLTPGETDYTACHPRKTTSTTYILHVVVTISTHTHDRRKPIAENKQRKEKKIKGRKGKEREESTNSWSQTTKQRSRVRRSTYRKEIWRCNDKRGCLVGTDATAISTSSTDRAVQALGHKLRNKSHTNIRVRTSTYRKEIWLSNDKCTGYLVPGTTVVCSTMITLRFLFPYGYYIPWGGREAMRSVCMDTAAVRCRYVPGPGSRGQREQTGQQYSQRYNSSCVQNPVGCCPARRLDGVIPFWCCGFLFFACFILELRFGIGYRGDDDGMDTTHCCPHKQ